MLVGPLKILFLILTFLLLSSWFVGSSKAFQSCVYQHNQESTEQPTKESFSQIISIVTIGSDCTGEFIHKNAEAITAAFTIILGVATILLWGATRDLVKDARESSRRQLRAYLSVTPKLVINWVNPSEKIGVSIHVKNHGQSPALELSYDFKIEIRGNIPPNLSDTDDQFDANTALFADDCLPVRFFKAPRFTNSEITSIETGDRRAYIWGKVSYRDIFNDNWSTTFSFSFGGPDFSRKIRKGDGAGWDWQYHQHHNEPA